MREQTTGTSNDIETTNHVDPRTGYLIVLTMQDQDDEEKQKREVSSQYNNSS